MNTVQITYEDESFKVFAPQKKVRDFLKIVCAELNLDNCEFSVSFISEDQMHNLNLEYRNIDDSTDILSFAVEDSFEDFDFILPEKQKRNIGDMLICIPVLKRNAQYFRVSENEELQRLLIHGTLHLSGENHTTNDIDTEPMLIKQENILKKLSKF